MHHLQHPIQESVENLETAAGFAAVERGEPPVVDGAPRERIVLEHNFRAFENSQGKRLHSVCRYGLEKTG